MRFLKNKIQRAQEHSKNQSQSLIQTLHLQDNSPSPSSEHSTEDGQSLFQPTENLKNKLRRSKNPVSKRRNSPMKNMALNYGKAIASFAVSHLATPYLKIHLEKERIKLDEFIGFVRDRKNVIRGITGLRSLILIEEGDTCNMAACKRLFQMMGVIFIKYFSVNWIMNGKLAEKITYVKFRGNMLRRVQNPESFTYIKERKKTCKNRQ